MRNILVILLVICCSAAVSASDDDNSGVRANKFRSSLIGDFDDGDLSVLPNEGGELESGAKVDYNAGGLIELSLYGVQDAGVAANISGALLNISGFVNGEVFSSNQSFDIVDGSSFNIFSLGLSPSDTLEVSNVSVADAEGSVFAVPGLVTNGEEYKFKSYLVNDHDEGDWYFDEKGRLEIRDDGRIKLKVEEVYMGDMLVNGSGQLLVNVTLNGVEELIDLVFTVEDGEVDEDWELNYSDGDLIEIGAAILADDTGQVFAVPGIIAREGLIPGVAIARQVKAGLIQDSDDGDWSFDEVNSYVRLENEFTGNVKLHIYDVNAAGVVVDGVNAVALVSVLVDGVAFDASFEIPVINGMAEVNLDLGLPAGTTIELQPGGVSLLDDLGEVFAVPGLIIGSEESQVEAYLVSDSVPDNSSLDTAIFQIKGEAGGEAEFVIFGVTNELGELVTGSAAVNITGQIDGIDFIEEIPFQLAAGNGAFEYSFGWLAGSKVSLQSVVVSTDSTPFGVPGVIINDGQFFRGDADMSATINLADSIFILRYLFVGGEERCLMAMDTDDSETVSIVDAILSLNVMFGMGGDYPMPSGYCGQDQTVGGLSCDLPLNACN